MIRDITLGQYYQTDSVIHRLDPRVKLVATFVYIISLFLFHNFTGYLVAALFLAMVIKLSHVPFRYMVKGMKAIVFSYYAKMNVAGNYGANSIYSPVFVSYNYMLNGNCIGNLTGMYDTKKCGKIFQKEIHHEDYVMMANSNINKAQGYNRGKNGF